MEVENIMGLKVGNLGLVLILLGSICMGWVLSRVLIFFSNKYDW